MTGAFYDNDMVARMVKNLSFVKYSRHEWEKILEPVALNKVFAENKQKIRKEKGKKETKTKTNCACETWCDKYV